MKSNDRIDRNQFMITSLDDMIDKNSNVRVIDAYEDNGDGQWGRTFFVNFLLNN